MTTSIFPVVCCDDLDLARDFYAELLELDVVFESGWYTLLRSSADPTVQVGFVTAGHPTVPEQAGSRPSGVLMSVEVADVDAVNRRALEMDATIVMALRDEEFGQRVGGARRHRAAHGGGSVTTSCARRSHRFAAAHAVGPDRDGRSRLRRAARDERGPGALHDTSRRPSRGVPCTQVLLPVQLEKNR